jgi:dTDP-4-dehydrorhamnose 3,5-epimerase
MTPEQIRVTPLRRISVKGGDVLHALKRTDAGFRDFGEAYFSLIQFGSVKAWKLHRRMTLNLIVPVGSVRFVFLADDGSGACREETIGESNYARLTVPPGIWCGFQGCGRPYSLILNVADIPHDPEEAVNRAQEEFVHRWGDVK